MMTDDFKYEVDGGNVAITKYTGKGGAVTVPGVIEGLPVTHLLGEAFFRCTGLTSIVLPDSITTIGGLAFYACSGLTSIVVPASVTFVGDTAFGGCRRLTSVTLPKNSTIGWSPFDGCSRLTCINSDVKLKSGI